MPWELQVCRFCGRGYGHKTGLRNHLSQYVGEWRIPADGIHDVLEIQKILHPDEDHSEYQCPARDCREIIATRQKLIEHVATNWHWGGFPEGPVRGLLDSNKVTDEESIDSSDIGEWMLTFTEAVKVFEPEGPFPFLRLPPELRLVVYEMTLCYPGIQLASSEEDSPSVRKGKVYFQHNTDHNPLALLITSRGIYEEARAVFYGKNEFWFSHIAALPIFLIGIGQANAKLLRCVRWWSAADHRYENQLGTIRPYIWGIQAQNPTTNVNELNIWNDYSTYLAFLKKIGHLSCIEPLPEPHRLLPWNPNDSSRANRMRYRLRIRFSATTYGYQFGYGHSNANIWLGRATYELICQVEKSGR